MLMWITSLVVTVAISLAVASPPIAAPAEPPPVVADSESWEAESFTIDLPVDWEQQDLSNRTYLSNSPKDTRAHFFRAAEDGDGAAMFLQYTAEPASEDPVPADTLRGLLEEGIATMAETSPDELQYFVQDKGHGCLDGFQLLRAPEMTPTSGMPGYHIAMDYEYGCFNGGAPVRGWAWVAYSPDGRKHNIFLTAPENVWIEDIDTLQAVAASVAVPQ